MDSKTCERIPCIHREIIHFLFLTVTKSHLTTGSSRSFRNGGHANSKKQPTIHQTNKLTNYSNVVHSTASTTPTTLLSCLAAETFLPCCWWRSSWTNDTSNAHNPSHHGILIRDVFETCFGNGSTPRPSWDSCGAIVIHQSDENHLLCSPKLLDRDGPSFRHNFYGPPSFVTPPTCELVEAWYRTIVWKRRNVVGG
jgi:hypothetical protein